MPRWLVFSLLTILLFGAWGALSKAASASLSPVECQGLSTAGLLPVVGALAFSRRARRGTRRLLGATCGLAAGTAVCAGNVPYFQALAAGGKASTVVSFTALYPVVTVLLSVTLLRERLRAVQAAGIALAVAAIYLLNVSSDELAMAAWLRHALLPVLLWGLGAFLQKVSSNHASSELSTLAFLAAFVPAGAALLVLAPPSSLGLRDGLLAILLGATFGLGNLSLLAAYGAGGKAAVVTPLAGLYPAVTAPLAVLCLQETLRAREMVGIAITLVALLALSIEGERKA
ncbi:MAG: DMT family transporter [Planctomycetes bacterium]|nr:DMT family transporter [Planctomycetota bacterium]